MFYQRGYNWTQANHRHHMGYNIRTEEWRYTEYVFMTDNENNTVSYTPDWEHQSDWAELYHHDKVPLETINLYDHPDYQQVRAELQDRLRAGWRQELVR